MSFKDFGLSEPLMKAISEKGYTEATPIQAQAIPPVLKGQDVVGIAQTGTGKTASFTLPMIEILAGGRARARMPRSLILAPTRELALQVSENFEDYGKHTGLSMALLIGGVSMQEQAKVLEKGVDVLIATPGRLLDQFQQGRLLMSDIKILVIDEADRMLDMGFIPDIEKIIKMLPRFRQTLMFSATFPKEIKRIAETFMMHPTRITVESENTSATTVEQFLVDVPNPRKKKDMLTALLEKEPVTNAIIFCNRKRDIAGVKSWLDHRGFSVGAMHGDMSQKERMETLKAFKDGKMSLLVCSDVAARGLDVQGLSHVFNFDVPNNSEDYVHRIGRTGRAGESGRAFTLVVKGHDDKPLAAVTKLLKRELPYYTEIAQAKKPAQPKSVPSEKHEKKSSPQRGQGQNKPKKQREQDKPVQEEKKVVGFGDDIPEFLR